MKEYSDTSYEALRAFEFWSICRDRRDGYDVLAVKVDGPFKVDGVVCGDGYLMIVGNDVRAVDAVAFDNNFEIRAKIAGKCLYAGICGTDGE
jgi:ABC-type sulfate transport system permease subunit